jgi:hypothetical protein
LEEQIKLVNRGITVAVSPQELGVMRTDRMYTINTNIVYCYHSRNNKLQNLIGYVNVAGTSSICIRGVPNSNLGRFTDYPALFRDFPQSTQENTGVVGDIKTCPCD